ncbi:unnamed protein product [Heligmosomoides polygyrus]|uniref:Uncharacterized protein n=1 Tax=Heligmosomoides polygyrus TaxID=6339 RepID=A0A183F3H9_HELPZ|nr:unnamed protein product [Heligmosomoides polygyrus]
MDSLLLLCRVDAFLVRGRGMFMHSVRGCACACADCSCVGSAKSLHSVDWEYIDGKDEYGEAAKISVPNKAAQIEKDYDDDLYLQHPPTPEKNCSSEHATAWE